MQVSRDICIVLLDTYLILGIFSNKPNYFANKYVIKCTIQVFWRQGNRNKWHQKNKMKIIIAIPISFQNPPLSLQYNNQIK